MTTGRQLSQKSTTVLQLVSAGWSYSQIVEMHPELSYFDVFGAAKEALELLAAKESPYDERMQAIRAEKPRAWEPWTLDEDDLLRQLVESEMGIDAIAERLQRRRGAIESRMRRLLLPLDAVGARTG